MVLPDNIFLDLMRGALGNVKTPFNKQRLLDDLSAFLARTEIQENIAALLDEDDRRIIAAVALLGEPEPNELERFFAGDFAGASLHESLLCLEERRIMYRFRDEGKSRLALNPKLETVLAPIAADTSSLFPLLSAVPDSPKRDDPAPLDDRTFAAFFSFLLSGERFFRFGADEAGPSESGGALELRKKAFDESKRLFPGLDVETLAGGIIALGLSIRDRERFRADKERLDAFRKLDKQTRAAYFAAGITLYLRGLEPAGSRPAAGFPAQYTSRGLIRSTAQLIIKLLDKLRSLDIAPEDGHSFPRPTLVKLAEILRIENKPAWDFTGEIPRTALILSAMEQTGLLSGGPAAFRLPPLFPPETPAVPAIAFDSVFSFIMYPGILFADALELALACDLKETGTAPRFELSRDSAARFFDRGGSVTELWELIKQLSDGRADESLKYNLEEWERRYHEVALYEGIIVVLGGERAYLADRGPLARMVRRVLVKADGDRPGVYLLDAPSREEAATVLRDAGVDIFAIPAPSSPVFWRSESVFSQLTQLRPDHADSINAKAPPPQTETCQTAWDSEKAERILESFRTALEKMKLDRQEKESLLDRIERRMIVSEAQLTGSSFRYEKLTARALDYAGKALIAKQAASSRELLEITWSAGGPAAVAGTAEGLDKKGSDVILLFRPRDGEETLRVPLGKISLMRRVKQSIFGE
jgi:hypothetical protein